MGTVAPFRDRPSREERAISAIGDSGRSWSLAVTLEKGLHLGGRSEQVSHES
ncbi:MAG: hypothetical protein OJF50_006592 [Nitrospira sp.]|nr:hypothetical protein [Nitrospira sp.]